MAQQKNSNKKEPGKNGGKRIANPKNTPKTTPTLSSPKRREISGFIMFFLGLFTLFGFFTQDAAFILMFTRLLKGLTGTGFWLFIPAFFLSSYIFMCHRGRPVLFRVACTMGMPLVFSAFLFGFIRKENRPSLSNVLELWDNGIALEGCGVLGSLLGGLCSFAFTGVGTIILCFVALVLLFLGAIDRSLMDFVDWLAARPRYEEPEEEKESIFRKLFPRKEPVQEEEPLPDKPLSAKILAQEVQAQLEEEAEKKAPPVKKKKLPFAKKAPPPPPPPVVEEEEEEVPPPPKKPVELPPSLCHLHCLLLNL